MLVKADKNGVGISGVQILGTHKQLGDDYLPYIIFLILWRMNWKVYINMTT